MRPVSAKAPTAPALAQSWPAIDILVDRAPTPRDLAAHRLITVAAHSWRARGQTVPAQAAISELATAHRLATARIVLAAVVDVLQQEVIVLKGISVAERYPDPVMRPFGDLDVLVADAPGAQAKLLAAGFVLHPGRPADHFRHSHHDVPICLPGHELIPVEVHARATGVNWGKQPTFADLRPASTPTCERFVRHPDRLEHVLLLASHAWESAPLRRVGDLLDIMVMLEDLDHDRAHFLATRWGVTRLWRETLAAINWLFATGPAPSSARTWARELGLARESSVLDVHVRRWLSPFWAAPWREMLPAAARALRDDLVPVPGERWAEKAHRMAIALFRPRRRISRHNEMLGVRAHQWRPLPRASEPRARR